MEKGTLSFSLNREFLGVAFNDEKLRKGPIWPAVSVLHCAVGKLVTGLEIPDIFKDC
jgi:E3 ubiquitin-protein ligase NRDP1